MTTDMTRFNPFVELQSMNKLMETISYGWPSVLRDAVELSTIDKTLCVDVFDQDDAIVVKAALPGVDPKDIAVFINDGVLTIRAENGVDENVKTGDYHRREYHYGKWSRSLRLPADCAGDKCEASFEFGMLRLRIPHSSGSKAHPVQIDVR